jgi:hypothetical protein
MPITGATVTNYGRVVKGIEPQTLNLELRTTAEIGPRDS